MKVGSAVLGLHIVAVVAFSLTQGCVTTESQGSGRGPGAVHKGPWRHQHTGKSAKSTAVAQDEGWIAGDSLDGGAVIVGENIDSGSEGVFVTPIDESGTSTARTETYIVQKDDILGRVAIKFDTTVETLMRLNNLPDKDVLYVGQELRIPAGRSSSMGISSAPKSSPTVKKGGEYMVQKGDTLSSIAVAAGVSIDELRTLNGITDDKIYAGKTIDIPSGGAVPAKTQSKAPKKEVKPEPPVVDSPKVEAPPVLTPVDVREEQAGAPPVEVDAVIDHLVYPGETLEDIALKYNAIKADIMRVNNLDDESAIKVGMVLRVPVAE